MSRNKKLKRSQVKSRTLLLAFLLSTSILASSEKGFFETVLNQDIWCLVKFKLKSKIRSSEELDNLIFKASESFYNGKYKALSEKRFRDVNVSMSLIPMIKKEEENIMKGGISNVEFLVTHMNEIKKGLVFMTSEEKKKAVAAVNYLYDFSESIGLKAIKDHGKEARINVSDSKIMGIEMFSDVQLQAFDLGPNKIHEYYQNISDLFFILESKTENSEMVINKVGDYHLMKTHELFHESLQKVMLADFINGNDFLNRLSFQRTIKDYLELLDKELDLREIGQRIRNLENKYTDAINKESQRMGNAPLERVERLELYKFWKQSISEYTAFLDEKSPNGAHKMKDYYSSLLENEFNLTQRIQGIKNALKQGQEYRLDFIQNDALKQQIKGQIPAAIERNLKLAEKLIKTDSQELRQQAYFLVNFIASNFVEASI